MTAGLAQTVESATGLATFIGIDIGTFETKGVLVRADGQVLAQAGRTHGISQPGPGQVEQDPVGIWWADLCAVARQLCAHPGAQAIAGVGLSAIGPCVVATDSEFRPLRPAILYGIDQRATRQIAVLETTLGAAEIKRRCGNVLSSQSAGAKIAWLRDEEPAIWRASRWFMTSQSWLVAKLTGQVVIDHGTAGYFHPLYDLTAGVWNITGCEDFIAEHQLPRLAWADEIAGRVTPQAAAETGLPAGVPVIVGTTDSPAEAVGAGVVDDGALMLQYGSSGYFIRVGNAEQQKSVDELYVAPFCFAGTSVLAAGTSTAGTATRWLCELLGLTGDDDARFGALVELAGQSVPGAHGLLMLPLLAGERTPFQDAASRGVLLGLDLRHNRADVARATLEGIGHSMGEAVLTYRRHNVPITRAVAVGGATRNPFIVATVGAVTGLTQEIRAGAGAPLGDAFLAALGTGAVAGRSVIHDWLPPARIVPPPSSEIYRRDHDDYLRTYHALASLQAERAAWGVWMGDDDGAGTAGEVRP